MKITKKYVEPKIRFHKLKGSKILAGSNHPIAPASNDLWSVQDVNNGDDLRELE